jgi:MFS transporter, DHA2 family, multidrug resistance protein
VPGTLVMILVPILVRIDKPDLTLLKGADYLGMVLMALCLGTLQYVLEEGARWDWFGDDTIPISAWISGLAGIGFIIRSLTFARPVVDLRALANRNFSLCCWFSFVNGIGIFGLLYLTPLFLGRVRGFIAWQIGGAILAAGLFQVCAIPIYSMFANRFDLRWLLMFGLSCFGISLWLFTPVMNQWGWQEMLLPFAFRGLASPFAIASTLTLALGGLARLQRVRCDYLRVLGKMCYPIPRNRSGPWRTGCCRSQRSRRDCPKDRGSRGRVQAAPQRPLQPALLGRRAPTDQP